MMAGMRAGHSATAQRLWVLLLLAASGGCTAGGRSGNDSYDANRRQADAEFDSGVNRPPTGRTLYAMAKLLQAQGRDAECEVVLARMVRDYPRFMPAYCDLAEVQLRQERGDDAIRSLEAGLRVTPQDPILLNNLGVCRMLKGEYADALGQFGEAAAMAPQETRYRANMALALGMLGRCEESLTLYQQVVPTAEAHYNLGVLCVARKDFARADDEYARAKTLGLISEPPAELVEPAPGSSE